MSAVAGVMLTVSCSTYNRLSVMWLKMQFKNRELSNSTPVGLRRQETSNEQHADELDAVALEAAVTRLSKNIYYAVLQPQLAAA